VQDLAGAHYSYSCHSAIALRARQVSVWTDEAQSERVDDPARQAS
jgi:hypothetical protein